MAGICTIAQPGSPRRIRARALWGLVVIVVAYIGLAAANPMTTVVHGDGYYTYLWARTIVFDADLDFRDDYALCGDPWGLADSPVGADVNYWNLGPALFWVPILAFDRLFHPAAASPNEKTALGCQGPLAERAVFGSLVAGVSVVWLGWLIARRYFGDTTAWLGALGVGLGSGLAYYACFLMSYGHAASSFAAGLLVWAWDRHSFSPYATNRQRLGSWLTMGGALGLAILMRSQNAILVLLPLGTWIAEAARPWRPVRWHTGKASLVRRVRADGVMGASRGTPARAARSRLRATAFQIGLGVVFTFAMCVVVFPQLAFLKATNGTWFTVSQGEHYMRWWSSVPHKALFSVHGLLPWSPVAGLALLGTLGLIARRGTRRLGLGLVVLVAVDSWVVGAVYDWWGSVGFPGRRFDMLMVPMIVGLAALISELRRLAQRRRHLALSLVGAPLAVLLLVGSIATQVGVAKGMRTDLAHISPRYWGETFERASSALWRAVGNPLTWPASLAFSARFLTHPRRWDMVGGHELFYHDHQTLELRPEDAQIVFGGEASASYADGRVVPVATVAHGLRGFLFRPGPSRVFLPLHWPDAGGIRLEVARLGDAPASIALAVNRTFIGSRSLRRPRARIDFALPDGATWAGINQLWIRVRGGSLVVGSVEVLDRTPSPAVGQRARNRSIRERLRSR